MFSYLNCCMTVSQKYSKNTNRIYQLENTPILIISKIVVPTYQMYVWTMFNAKGDGALPAWCSMDILASLCVEFRALYVDLKLLCVELGPHIVDGIPHITKLPTIQHRFFVITITKTKRFFMGALVGALILIFFNKTNNKQYVNRRYDSESGTTNLKNPPTRRVFAFV